MLKNYAARRSWVPCQIEYCECAIDEFRTSFDLIELDNDRGGKIWIRTPILVERRGIFGLELFLYW